MSSIPRRSAVSNVVDGAHVRHRSAGANPVRRCALLDGDSCRAIRRGRARARDQLAWAERWRPSLRFVDSLLVVCTIAIPGPLVGLGLLKLLSNSGSIGIFFRDRTLFAARRGVRHSSPALDRATVATCFSNDSAGTTRSRSSAGLGRLTQSLFDRIASALGHCHGELAVCDRSLP